ncbi:MAG: ABC-type transport auxiliary lipoprotein family protein [Sphingomonadales bacterium]
MIRRGNCDRAKAPTRFVRVLVVAGLLAGGCSPQIDLFNSGPPASLYNLTPAKSAGDGGSAVDWALYIEDPTSTGALDSDRIAMRPSPNEVQYFADARWVDRAPRMLRSLLVESFENSGRIRSVTAEVTGLPYNYSLKVELRDFQAEVQGQDGVPAVRVRLNAKIIRRAPISLIGARNFEEVQTASGTDMPSTIAAFDRATAAVLRDAIAWTLDTADAAND